MELSTWIHPRTGQTRRYLNLTEVEEIALQVGRDTDNRLSNADLRRIQSAKFWLDQDGVLHIDALSDGGKIFFIQKALRAALEAELTEPEIDEASEVDEVEISEPEATVVEAETSERPMPSTRCDYEQCDICVYGRGTGEICADSPYALMVAQDEEISRYMYVRLRMEWWAVVDEMRHPGRSYEIAHRAVNGLPTPAPVNHPAHAPRSTTCTTCGGRETYPGVCDNC